MKKICLITPGHISSNPRSVKEAAALCESGYEIHIIFVQNLDFLIQHDETILKANPTWTFDVLNNKDSKLKNKLSRLFRSLFAIIAMLNLKWAFSFNNLAINKNYYWQYKKAVKAKADLYIAHNLGALPVAVFASKKNKAKVGFDAEDFHRYEVTDDINSKAYQLAKFIEDKYLPEVNYLTIASPLIREAYQKEYPNLNPLVINNVFSAKFLQKVNPYNKDKELKLFWFSQTIGKGRGIEDAIKAIATLEKQHISLTLLGNIDNENGNYFLQLANSLKLKADQLNFIKPILPDDIFEMVNRYDIGLALEQTIPCNRNICLTNKIFTYLTSGLAVIASETSAQKTFMEENPSIGKIYPIGNIEALAKIINEYDQNRELLNETKQKALSLAKTKYNWEKESIEFIKIISQTLAI